MPYKIQREEGMWKVQDTDTRNVKGSHKTYAGALKQFRLLQGKARGWRPTGAKSTLVRKKY